MKLIALLLLSLTLSGTKQACAAGCLKCDASSNCIIADISQGYVLSNNSAVKTSLTNCLILGADGKCNTCTAGFFLDSTGKCTQVPTASVITNCQYYATATTCRLCASGFYLNNNACAAVTATIANCANYATATVCAACNTNYILALDSLSCVSVSSIANCSGFTYVTCSACATGYHLNRNDYITSSLSVGSSDALTNLTEYGYEVATNSNFIGIDVCTANTNTNCTTFAVDTNVCTLCNAGYFLDTAGVCNLYPVAPILNCGVYTNATTCFSCNAGYTLTNSTTCTAVAANAAITNCATYNTGSSSVTCVTCNTGFYLTNNTCTARVNSANIASCATYNPSDDKCATCAVGTVITNDFLKCNAVIANCATHTSVDKNTVVQCATCNPTYYLTAIAAGATQNSCTLGTVGNCSGYNTSNTPPTCNLCLNGYYLNAGACTQQPAITNCANFDTTNQGVCTSCNPALSVVATLGNVCVAATAIPNCAVLGGTVASPTCTTCAKTFFATNNTTCTAITAPNCTIGSSVSVCLNCAAGTVLNRTGSACVAPFAFNTDQCQQTTVTADNTNTVLSNPCSQCKQGAIPYVFTNQFACVSAAEARIANSDTDLQPNYATRCQKLSNTFNCVQCLPNQPNKFLVLVNSPGFNTCNPDCGTFGYDRYLMDSTVLPVNYNVCKASSTVTDCLVYAPNLNLQAAAVFGSVCVGCNTSSIPVLTLTIADYSNVDPKAEIVSGSALPLTYSTYVPAAFARYPVVTCRNFASPNTITINGSATPVSTNTPIPSCDYYIIASSNNEYSCLRCATGFSGIPNTSGYITSCNAIQNCSTSVVYRNLTGWANLVISCFSCSGTSVIPILAYNIQTAGAASIVFNSFGRYASTTNFAADATNASNRSIECRSVVPANVPTGVSNWSITSSCGIGGVIINNNGGSNSGNTVGNYCIACKPGFAPSVPNLNAAKTCAQITGCTNGGNMFDGCSTCDNLFVLQFIANPVSGSNITFQSCLSYTSANSSAYANCYAATVGATPGTAGNCAQCNTGYNLNLDYICEAVTPYNCAANAFKAYGTSIAANADWSIYLAGNGPGCNSCTNSNIALQIGTSPVCVQNSYVATSVDSSSTSSYIEHCKIYANNYANSAFTCLTCQTNYIPDLAGRNCYLSNASSFTNCGFTTNVGNTAVQCLECATPAFSLSTAGVCTAGAIANCAIYNYSSNVNTFTSNHDRAYCLQCNAGFYPASDNLSCLAALVTNCANSSSDVRCTTCATGYILINNSSGSAADACVPTPTVGNCGVYAAFTNNTLACSTCATPASQVLVANPATVKSACLAFSPVTGCTAYTAATLNGSSFACTACPATAFLANNKCNTRTTIANCSAYSPTSNVCTACSTGYFLAADSKSCTAYPNGIFKCATYSNATTCTACASGFYLANNTCTAVPAVITNCAAYSAATTCSACATSYALSNNTCVSATAQNCATYNSPSACATCPQGYVLSTANNVTNCTALTKTGCATIDANPPNNCLSCNANFYLSSGACLAATTIARCTVYASATTCAQCDAGYALNSDKTACTTTTNIAAYDDGNCTNSQVVTAPVCSRCSAGRYFVNGACTGTCSVTGCLACSPSANTVCYICASGYYMDSTANCIAISSAATTTKSASIFGVLSAFMVLIVVMFK